MTVLHGDSDEVVRLCPSPDQNHLAVGYHNGAVKIYELVHGTEVVTFSGHKSAVSALVYDEQGMMLASGAKVIVFN